MVLETTSMPDSYDASSETLDPYDTKHLSINLEELPQPPPIIGPLFGYTNQFLANLAETRLRYHSEAVGRALSQQEREAIYFYAYKGATISSIGLPIAFSYGIYRAHSTRENFRFPLWGNLKKEGGWWDGSRIRLMGQVVSQGSNARFWVHSLRYSAYSAWAMLLGGLFVNSYATTVAAVGELRDPRLKDYQNAIHAKAKQRSAEADGLKPPSKDPTGQGDTSVSDLWKRHRKDIGGFDDASPSAGADGYGGEVERLGGSNTGILSDAQMRMQETRQQASSSDSPTENRASTFRLDKVEKQPRNFSDTFDDASPTAENAVDQPQGGNAWDRIRRQAQNPTTGAKQKGPRWNPVRKERQEGSTTGDSFAFSSDEEQRQLAKDEAQNEFDARVERERQGGSFDEKRGKKW